MIAQFISIKYSLQNEMKYNIESTFLLPYVTSNAYNDAVYVCGSVTII